MPRKPEQINPAEGEFDYEEAAKQIPSNIQSKAEDALGELRQAQKVEEMKEDELEEMMRAAERGRPDIQSKAERVIETEKAEELGKTIEEAAQKINPSIKEGFEKVQKQAVKKEAEAKESEEDIKKTLENLSSDIPGVDELKKEIKAETVKKEAKEVLKKIENFAKTEKENEELQKEENLKKEIKNQLIVIKRSAESDSGKLAECRRMEEEVEKDPRAVAYEMISDILVVQDKESLSKSSELARLRSRDRLLTAIKLAEMLTGRNIQKEAEEKIEDKFKNISEKEYLSPKAVFNKKMDIKKAEGTDIDEDILNKRYGWTTEVVKGIFSRKLIYKNKKGEIVGELKINIFGQVVDRVALTRQCLDKEIEKELKLEFGNRQQNRQEEIEQYKEQELKKILEGRPQTAAFKELSVEPIPKPAPAPEAKKPEFNLEGVDFGKLNKEVNDVFSSKVEEVRGALKDIYNNEGPVKKSVPRGGIFPSGKTT